MSICHIKDKAGACPCQGDAEVLLMIKHHHTPDGGCEETTVSMCHHHYGHYLLSLAAMMGKGMLQAKDLCSRCGREINELPDVFERVA